MNLTGEFFTHDQVVDQWQQCLQAGAKGPAIQNGQDTATTGCFRCNDRRFEMQAIQMQNVD